MDLDVDVVDPEGELNNDLQEPWCILEHSPNFQALVRAVARRLSTSSTQEEQRVLLHDSMIQRIQEDVQSNSVLSHWCPTRLHTSVSTVRSSLRRLHAFFSTAAYRTVLTDPAVKELLRTAFLVENLPRIRLSFRSLEIASTYGTAKVELLDCPSENAVYATTASIASARAFCATAHAALFVVGEHDLHTAAGKNAFERFFQTMTTEPHPEDCRFVVNLNRSKEKLRSLSVYVPGMCPSFHAFEAQWRHALKPESIHGVANASQSRSSQFDRTLVWLNECICRHQDNAIIRICVVGTANAGKSTLVNAILGNDVSPTFWQTNGTIPLLFQHDPSLRAVHDAPLMQTHR